MLVLPELPLTKQSVQMVVTPVSPKRFLELAMQNGLDARIPWQTAIALSQLLQIPFPTSDIPAQRIPNEFLVAKDNNQQLELYYVLYEEL